jgi:hypothetical protein
MNSSTEIPKEAKAQDEARASLDAVRKPWYSWQTSSLSIPLVVVWLGGLFLPSSLLPVKWWNTTFLVVTFVVLFLNQYYRDKAWRRLIELEAPELHRRLKGTDE